MHLALRPTFLLDINDREHLPTKHTTATTMLDLLIQDFGKSGLTKTLAYPQIGCRLPEVRSSVLKSDPSLLHLNSSHSHHFVEVGIFTARLLALATDDERRVYLLYQYKCSCCSCEYVDSLIISVQIVTKLLSDK